MPAIASLDWLFSRSFTVEATQSLGMFKPPVPRGPMSFPLSFGFRDNSDQYLQMILRFILRVSELNSLLHAAEVGSVRQVQELIKSGVRLNSSKNGYGMTALHVAVYRITDETDIENVVEALCGQGRIAIDIKDNHGYTALSYAITEGRPEQVVRKLLKYGADVHILHHAGTSPLAMAEAKDNLPASVMTLMRNNPVVAGPSSSCIADHPATRTRLTNSVEIAKRFSFVMTELYVDMDTNTELHLTRHKPVSEVLSGEADFKTVFKPDREMLSEEKSANLTCTCQWIHLPTNNVSWLESFFWHKLKIDGIWAGQMRNSRYAHGRHVAPHASWIIKSDSACHQNEEQRSILAISIPYVSYEVNTRQRHITELVENESQTRELDVYLRGIPRKDDMMCSDAQHGSPSPSISKEDSVGDATNVASFPKKDPDEKNHESGPRLSLDEVRLHTVYLRQDSPLHIRRTIDQYSHHWLSNTKKKDCDQVVGRWAKDHNGEQTHNILMVDQLWLWFIQVDGVPDCVLTCFPDRFGVESQEFDELRSNILAIRDRQLVDNSKDLIMRTLQACLSTFEPPKQAPFVDFLAMFQETVSKLASVEDKLQNGFIGNLEKLEKLNKRDLKYQEEKARCLEGILDIVVETKTLKEADDVFDEINTIIQVLKQQHRVLRGNVLAQFLGGVRPSRTRSSVVAGEYGGCLLTIQRALDNFEALLKQINQIRVNLKRLCDLRQRTANVWEVRSAREGAQETGRQSGVMVVFTTVTIIFLPLSFMASFFAINIDRFPSDKSGQTNWPFQQLCGYLFGLSFAVSALLIVFVILFGSVSCCSQC